MMNKILSLALVLLSASAIISCSRNEDSFGEYLIPYSQTAPRDGMALESPLWKVIHPVTGFHAPWSGLDDSTSFRCFATDSLFFFRFDVVEGSLALVEDFKDEMDVGPEDRVEIFFAPTGELGEYIGAEMDPAGRVLDYECTFYRQFDYGWDSGIRYGSAIPWALSTATMPLLKMRDISRYPSGTRWKRIW